MTDRTNVITVTQPNLEWINANVPGSSKQKRLEKMLKVFQDAQTEYDGYVSFLEEMEAAGKLDDVKGAGDDFDSIDVAIQKYELLHKILSIEGEPRWSS